MKVVADNLYHIYNQGNNRQQIFGKRDNYLLFLRLYKKHVLSRCDTLCYCLMPNHFHFLIRTNESSIKESRLGNIYIQYLTDGFRRLLSSYSNELNHQNGTSGSLFRQKTKAKLLDSNNGNVFSYAELCFNYIHFNPVKANLVSNPVDWEFSSAREYLGVRNGTIVNRELWSNLFNWSQEDLRSWFGVNRVTEEIKSQLFELK